MSRVRACLAAFVVVAFGGIAAAQDDDPWLWLEELEGTQALEWVEAQNARTMTAFEEVTEYDPIYERALAILDSEDRIPYPSIRQGLAYNFWQDSEHERGVWRRTTLASYRSADPEWETLLDIDALVEAEGVPWAFKGVDCLEPEGTPCLVKLARGGSDAVTVREFDLAKKVFVEDGFRTPEAKTFVSWKDAETLWIATDFGVGSLTPSGYPRQVREWRRGTALAEARLVFEARSDDVLALGRSAHTPDGVYHFMVRMKSFFDTETFIVLENRLVRLDVPSDAEAKGLFRDHVLLSLRNEWKIGDVTYPVGALLAIDLDDLLRDNPKPDVLFEPTETVFLNSVAVSRDRVLITVLDNVRGRLYSLALTDDGWKREELALPGLGTVGVRAWELEESFMFNYQDFVTPASLFLVEKGEAALLKSQPAQFDAEGVEVTQHHAVSADGTRIPYFLVTPKGFEAGGTTPTLVTGYGGFEVNMLPTYSAVTGAVWLERGGAYALANLRGGGEFGPAWHQAAVREGRIKWFEDFIAVADDLVARKTTSRKHLGIVGGSNSGLLVGGAFVMRPDLCGAVVCQVPLLDMKRYHKLLAGASWMSEYGNPDVPEDWAYMKLWSPYHTVQKDQDYPPILLWANHRDDRVHAGHARKMAARMQGMGHEAYYFEPLEGGHGAGTVSRQKAELAALEYAFLWKTLR